MPVRQNDLPTPAPHRAASGVGALLAWRPLQLLLLAMLLVMSFTVVRSRLDPLAAEGVSGGIVVDTSGAAGEIEQGQFRLKLPLAVANRTDNVIVGIRIWTDAWACPQEWTPTADCRKLLSTAQEYEPMLPAGSSRTFRSELTGGLPPGASDGDSVRIARRVDNIYDDRDVKRDAALANMH